MIAAWGENVYVKIPVIDDRAASRWRRSSASSPRTA